MAKAAAIVFSCVTVALWAVALPVVLVADADAVAWRGPLSTGVGALAVVMGTTLVWRGAEELSSAGVGLFGAVPGPVLVTSGVYSRLRNPIEVGTMLVSVGPWVVLRSELMWVVPAAAAVWLVAGIGPYEDRRLLEQFGDEFTQYRSIVSKWLPSR